MSGLRLHSRQWRFSKPSEWGKPSSGLDGEPAACGQAALKQQRLPRDGRRIQQPEAESVRNGASVYLCFRQGTQPLLHHNANHQGWLAPSDTRLDFMVPLIHEEQTWHDMWRRHEKLRRLAEALRADRTGQVYEVVVVVLRIRETVCLLDLCYVRLWKMIFLLLLYMHNDNRLVIQWTVLNNFDV